MSSCCHQSLGMLLKAKRLVELLKVGDLSEMPKCHQDPSYMEGKLKKTNLHLIPRTETDLPPPNYVNGFCIESIKIQPGSERTRERLCSIYRLECIPNLKLLYQLSSYLDLLLPCQSIKLATYMNNFS